MNRPLWASRHAAPPDAPATAPGGESDETLVVDARAGLTPADVVERTLRSRLRGGPVSASHVRMGPARARGVEVREDTADVAADRRRAGQSLESEVERIALLGPEAPRRAGRGGGRTTGREQP